MLTKEEKILIKDVIATLLEKLMVSGTFESEEKDEILHVVLETEDTGIVIGYHGEVLDGLQLIMSLVISKHLGRYIRVSVEVGDYKKNREEYLQSLAQRVKEKALEQHQEQVISELKPWERRIVHLALQDDTEVVSESSGEGRDRVLVVRPR